MTEWGPPSSSQTPRQPTDGIDALLLKIQEIRRQIADLPNGLLRAAGIEVTPTGIEVHDDLRVKDGGELRIEYPETFAAAEPAAYFGRLVSEDTGEYFGSGLLVQGPQGQDVLMTRAMEDGSHEFRVADNEGTGVLRVGVETPRGITTPSLTIAVPSSHYLSWGYATGGAFTTVAEGYAEAWHGGIFMSCRAVAHDGATAGEIRAVVYDFASGVEHVLDSPQAIDGTISRYAFSGNLPDEVSMSGEIFLRLQARVTAGAGKASGVVVGAKMRRPY